MTLALTSRAHAAHEGPKTPHLRAEWARCLADVRAAQRLRYRVFVEEGGAEITTSMQHHELDAFDPWCEHLLVRHPADGEVIGTYRVLTPEKARLQGGLYADAEFDLAPLLARGLDTMIGSASVPMRDGGHAAASLWTRLRETHLATPALRVQPRLPLPVERLDCTLPVEPPPLVKGYLRLGARLLGAPAWDPVFQTADLPMLVRLSELPARYRRHFLADAAATG
jgi:putative hemolysin